MTKERIDKNLVRRGLAASRTRAQRLIEEGHVTLNGKVIREPSTRVSDADDIVVTGDAVPWVSRAALKLLHALDTWGVDVSGARCLDIGSSTGGFTEVLLSRGAKEVIALDVGTGQLAEKLRMDTRVRSIEGTHIDAYRPGSSEERPEIVTIDVSFISLKKVFPRAAELLAPRGKIIALIKPQFEVGKGNTKEGIVADPALRARVAHNIVHLAKGLGFSVSGPIESPIEGGDGNIEYLILAER